MKKLAMLAAAASLSIATPVFACPHEEGAKTAEKAPAPDKAPEKEKEAPAKDTTAKAKEQPNKEEPKKPDKVSQK